MTRTASHGIPGKVFEIIFVVPTTSCNPPCFAEQNASPKRAEDFPPYGFRIGACRFTAEDETFVIVIIKTAEAMHKGQISVKKNEKCTVPIWRMDRVQILLRKYEKLPLAYL
jgi:hypothetical protein